MLHRPGVSITYDSYVSACSVPLTNITGRLTLAVNSSALRYYKHTYTHTRTYTSTHLPIYTSTQYIHIYTYTHIHIHHAKAHAQHTQLTAQYDTTTRTWAAGSERRGTGNDMTTSEDSDECRFTT